MIPLLAPHCRVIAPDFLGHGYSDRRDFFDRSLLAQTDMILRLMDHLGIERADFVGHDTGGGVSLIMAIDHPERVARLVLTNVVAYDSWPIDDMIALGNPNWRSKSPKEVADFLASGLPDGIYNKDRLTPEFRAGIVAPYSDEEGKISIIRNASASTPTTRPCWSSGMARSARRPCACGACTIPGRRSATARGCRAKFPMPVSCGSRTPRIGSRTTRLRSSPRRCGAFSRVADLA